MKIKALQPFSTGDFSMQQYEVKIVDDALGAFLVNNHVAVELKTTNGDILFITSHLVGREYIVLDATWQEIHDAALCVITFGENKKLVSATYIESGLYYVKVISFDSGVPYEFYRTIVPDGQPEMQY